MKMKMKMKKIIQLVALSFFVHHSLMAATLPTTKSDFCSRFNDPASIKSFSIDPANLMSFENNGGIFNRGVCWWHSRFQRNVLYLSLFRPDLPIVKPREIMALIKEIRRGEKVIIIPGFSNFTDFSEAFKREIQAELDDWQLYDGIVLGSWIDGLKGDTHLEPALLKKSLDEVYTYVESKNKIAYQKLQIKGITSHSWLVVAMKQLASGYDVGFVDSNNPRMTESYSYKIGEDSFFIKSYGNFVPYLGFTREEERLTTAARTYCGLSLNQSVGPEQWGEDYKKDLEEMKKLTDVLAL